MSAPAGLAPWAARRERGSARLLDAMLWVTFNLGAWASRLLLPPITAWFLASSPMARAASREYLGRVTGRPAGLLQVARHFHSFAGAVLDRVFLITGRTAGFHIDVEGLQHVAGLVEGGQGCVLLGAHLGSFEVLRALALRCPVPVRALMFRRNAGAMTALLDRLAPDLRDGIIEIGDTASMLRAHECVRRGEVVGILADRTPAGHRQVMAPFLGTPAAFPAGPFVLAATIGAPVVLFHGARTGWRRYTVRFEPFAERVVLRRASREADLQDVVGRYAEAIGGYCRAHPDNWFNFFPFWEMPRHADMSDAAGHGPRDAALARPR